MFMACVKDYPSSKIYINNQQMHFSINDVFHSQCCHQHVSTGIPAIFGVRLYYKNTNVQMC